MRVLHVIPSVAQRYGGPSRAVIEMCRALRQDGVDTLIATTDADNPGEVGQCKGQSLPSITVQVAPFTATVSGTGAAGNTAPFTLTIMANALRVAAGIVERAKRLEL